MSSDIRDCDSSSVSGNVSAGQPLHRSPWIVEPSSILASEQLDIEEWTWKDLAEEIHDNCALLRFLARKKLIRNEMKCGKCERNFNINRYKVTDQYMWRCNDCKKTLSIRKESDLFGLPGGLFENVSLFYRLFDLPSADKLDDLSEMSTRATRDRVATTIFHGINWLEKNLILGGTHAVFIDLHKPEGTSTMLFMAVEESTNLAVAKQVRSVANVPSELEKWCEPRSTIVLKQSSIDRSSLDSRKFEYENVEEQSASLEGLKEGHKEAVSNFVKELKRTKTRLKSIGSKELDMPTYQAALVVSLQRYFARCPAKNPFGRFICCVNTGSTE
eukprot:scpid71538/ scgid16846/ 